MRLKTFQKLCEVKGEKAHREAIAMGLKYKGVGYWADPQTGETKYTKKHVVVASILIRSRSYMYMIVVTFLKDGIFRTSSKQKQQ